MTVICPTHLSALQLRRRLARMTDFAAVRFETLPRLAELIGAGRLAAAGRRPMARPIGDHLAERVAAEARPPLDPIRDLPGFSRALRRLFARLRRAGLRGGEPLPPGTGDPHLVEVVRLYGLWRELIAAFYDEDDLLDAAAEAVEEDPARAAELGALHLVPPGPRSHSGDRLLAALRDARGGMVVAAEPAPSHDVRLVLAPDLASEAREAAREVLDALAEGTAIHEIAVLHGADRAYAEPLREALRAASLPVAAMPGTPLVQAPAGRGVLALLEVARSDLSRTALIDALGLAPVRRDLPGAGGERVPLRLGRWDRLSRAAGVTHGIVRWRDGIRALCDDRSEQMAAASREGIDRSWLDDEIAEAIELLGVVETLWRRLQELRPEQPAAAVPHPLPRDRGRLPRPGRGRHARGARRGGATGDGRCRGGRLHPRRLPAGAAGEPGGGRDPRGPLRRRRTGGRSPRGRGPAFRAGGRLRGGRGPAARRTGHRRPGARRRLGGPAREPPLRGGRGAPGGARGRGGPARPRRRRRRS